MESLDIHGRASAPSDVLPRRIERVRDADRAAGRPRVLYVWNGDYPWDVRTEKVCAALTRAGHDVHLAATNRARRDPRERLAEGTVHRLPSWPAIGRRGDAALQMPVFVNPRWIAHLTRTVRAIGPDVIITRDLPLAPASLSVGRRFGVPVVLDMAENYPSMMREIFDAGRQKPIDYLARNPTFTAAVERYTIRRVDHVLCVVDEMAERLQSLGVPPERVTVVSNTPPLARLRAMPERAARPAGAPLLLGYLGILEIPRGIGDALEAVSLLRAQGMDVRLRVIGEGRDRVVFEAQARALGLEAPAAEFTGHVPSHEEALRLLAEADIGMLPYRTSEQWNTTIANKLFDYMAAGMPVIGADVRPLARILGATGAGAVFRSRDPRDLARVIAAMADPERRRAAGEAGRRAIAEQYHWEQDVARLVRSVRSVAAGAERARAQRA